MKGNEGERARAGAHIEAGRQGPVVRAVGGVAVAGQRRAGRVGQHLDVPVLVVGVKAGLARRAINQRQPLPIRGVSVGLGPRIRPNSDLLAGNGRAGAQVRGRRALRRAPAAGHPLLNTCTLPVIEELVGRGRSTRLALLLPQL